MPVLRALCGEDYSPDINAPPDTGAVDIATQDIARFIALHLCSALWAQGSCGYSSLLEELNLTPWALMSDSCSTLKQLMVEKGSGQNFQQLVNSGASSNQNCVYPPIVAVSAGGSQCRTDEGHYRTLHCAMIYRTNQYSNVSLDMTLIRSFVTVLMKYRYTALLNYESTIFRSWLKISVISQSHSRSRGGVQACSLHVLVKQG
ncbi:hypothetical protein I7I51_02632 [Histoplasma capsulatum]|uniref:Uncharacterized protein n=1 Tax=Ajellomyces capsulatus TaxID=5037 RepID=A0A8A1MAB5_AJECA|nr:hypothetical protein I7I51_02632 [Histoplasma capsulatum]